MDIRRIRFIVPKETDQHWTDWEEVAVYKDAKLSQVDSIHRFPGQRFQLKIPFQPTKDMEIYHEWEGFIRILMVGAELSAVYTVNQPDVTGFVCKSELEIEKAYRAGIYPHDYRYSSEEYVREQWQVI